MSMSKKISNSEVLSHYTCPECKLILRDAVQPTCGHRICQSCADKILANAEAKKTKAQCPECGEDVDNEDGAFVRIVE